MGWYMRFCRSAGAGQRWRHAAMAKVSVIIPVYNVRAYLRECVDSVRAQSHRDMEILLVDDGSTDGSGELCDILAAEDARIRVMHKPNGGVSAARNDAIEAATGDYLLFIDGDDTIDPRMAEKMLSMAEKHDAEIVCCELTMRMPDGSMVPGPTQAEFVCTGREALSKMLSANTIHGYACNKMFARSVLDARPFPEDIRYAEDASMVMDALPRAKRVAMRPEGLYLYRRNAASATYKAFDERYRDFIRVYARKEAEIREKYPECVDGILFRQDLAHFMVLDKMIESGVPSTDARYRESEQWIRRNCLRILRSPAFNLRRKLGAMMIAVNGNIYRKAAGGYMTRQTNG